jgi:hypothetical protein
MKNLLNKLYSRFFADKKCNASSCSRGACGSKCNEEKNMAEDEKKAKTKKTTKVKTPVVEETTTETKVAAPKRKKP